MDGHHGEYHSKEVYFRDGEALLPTDGLAGRLGGLAAIVTYCMVVFWIAVQANDQLFAGVFWLCSPPPW